MTKHLAAIILFLSASLATVAQHSVTLKWTQPAQPAGETIATVQVVRDTTTTPIATLAPTVLTYTDSTVNAGETHTYTVNNVDAAGNSAGVSTGQVVIPGGTTAGYTARVKPSPAYTDSQKNVWSVDSVCSGGTTYSVTHAITGALPASTDAALYQVERYNNPKCVFPTPAGTYTLTVKESENYWTATGKRLFGITINGVSVASGIDLFKLAGAEYKAVDLTYTFTTSGTTMVAFVNGTADNAKYNAIQLVAAGPPPPPAISVAIAPTSASVMPGGTQQFTATVTNDSANAGVTWSANAPAGLFSAGTLSGTATVTATSVTDPIKSASATVTISIPALVISCPTAAAGVSNLTAGSFSMTVTQGARTANCSGTN